MFSKVDETGKCFIFHWLLRLIFSRVDTDSLPETQDAGMIIVKIKLVERCSHRPNNKVQDLPAKKRGKHSAGQLRVG